jgi:phospholipid/cholesterol/gamma-HCH transport system substrate-binding protein
VKISKEAKTGLLAVFAIATFILGYNYLKGINFFKSDRTFHAVYDNVEGLGLSSDVTINGLKVGKIQEITILEHNASLLVTFTVESDFQFSKTSIARIYGGGIIGGKSLAIIPDFESNNLAKSGDTLVGNIEEGIMELVNDRLTPLQQKIEATVVSADSLITSFNLVMNKETQEDLRQTMKNFNETSGSLKNSSVALEDLLVKNKSKLNNTFENLDKTAAKFATLSDTLSRIEFGSMVKEIEKTIANLNTFSEKLNSEEGNIGRLLHDDELYKNLDGATRQLEELLQDIKLNPKRYVHFSVFGKKPGPYEEPENRDD